MNHNKIRLLGIKPERVRELINQIDMQQINIGLIKKEILSGSCNQAGHGGFEEAIQESPLVLVEIGGGFYEEGDIIDNRNKKRNKIIR